MDYERELTAAIAAVRKAVHVCSKVQSNIADVESIEKKDHSPVTIADLGSQAIISLDLMRTFPHDAIVGEEEADVVRADKHICGEVLSLVNEHCAGVTAAQMIDAIDYGARKTDFTRRYWTVDPIDGTKGFLRNDQYAIALALVEHGEVVAGVLGCPNYPLQGTGFENGRGSIFAAVKGRGAFRMAPAGDERVPVSVDGVSEGRNARFCESVEKAHASHEDHARIAAALGITAPAYRIDSQAKYAAVASGEASIYLRLPRSREYREKIWDHAAGVIIVQEAGGTVTDFSGNGLNFTLGKQLKDNVGILVTNGRIHQQVLNAIAAVTGT